MKDFVYAMNNFSANTVLESTCLLLKTIKIIYSLIRDIKLEIILLTTTCHSKSQRTFVTGGNSHYFFIYLDRNLWCLLL